MLEKESQPLEGELKEAYDAMYSIAENALKDIAHVSYVILKAQSEKIKQLEQQLAMSYGNFDSEKELKAYKAFHKKHSKCQLSSKANSGKVPYIIPTGTGIGVCKKVVCPICGAEKDITDIDVW